MTAPKHHTPPGDLQTCDRKIIKTERFVRLFRSSPSMAEDVAHAERVLPGLYRLRTFLHKKEK